MQRTPIYPSHVKLGGKLIDFGGWELPVQYSGIQAEHKAVRERVGLFDVSHMGEVTVEGVDAEAFVNHIISNDVTKLVDGQALYTVMCYPNGGIVDDLIVYRRDKTHFFICVNAANRAKDFAWFQENRGSFRVELKDLSDAYAQIAVQGPKAEAVLARWSGQDLSAVKTFRFIECKVQGTPVLMARTGYTGEDGFEIYLPAKEGARVWDELLEAGKDFGILPCGLGARDTLRLEAGLSLYGNDIDAETNPLEAGLGWVVKLAKPDFIGKAALEKVKAEGPKRKLVGIRMKERQIPRHHYEVYSSGGAEKIGFVTSGTLSPSLDIPIAIAYIDSKYAAEELAVKVRDRMPVGEVIKLPFYRRKKEL